MKRFLRAGLALALAATMPMTALAQHGGGGHPAGGGGHPSGGGARPAPAPASRPAPAPAVRPPQPGFSLPHDVARPAPVYPAHPAAPNAGRPIAPGAHSSVPAPGRATYRAPQPLPRNYRGPVVGNPQHWGGWGWNHGRTWYPAPIYWGGGFWGPYAFGALTGALLLGSIIDYPDQIIYPSYQVQPLTPGAQLLRDYNLTQTPCGPPNLVVIWGPGNSVICAYPNNMVSAGNYQVDPTTLSLVSSPTPPQQ